MGNDASPFNTVFDGNGYSITGQTVPAASAHSGLFGVVGATGVIRNLGIINPTVTVTGGQHNAAGGRAGELLAGGVISRSFVRGGTVRANGNRVRVGGLVGQSFGVIQASYATAAVGTTSGVTSHYGGLVGRLRESAAITASYAAGRVSPSGAGNSVGGFVGETTGPTLSITDGYWDLTATGQGGGIGARFGTAQPTAGGYSSQDLKRPTGYTGLYRDWNIDLDGDPATDDDPWDFGTHRNYPLLKADKNGDGRATCEEFSGPPCYRAPGPPPYNPAHDHPEIYANPRHKMATSCAVETTGDGDDAVSTSTLTFDLGSYTRPITLALSLWDGTHFRSRNRKE